VSSPPLISIVIPCYNHAHFLAEAMRSAATSSRPTEIIVVDDGSIDDTADVVESARRTTSVDIRYVRQANAGLSSARNRGFDESRGGYTVFLDADDRLTPGGLDIGAAALDDRPDCAFVFGRCQMMAKDGTLLATPEQPRIAGDHYRALLRRNYIWMPAMVMFRREAVELAGGFRSVVNASADYELYLHIARHHPVLDHGQVVAYYRKHGANMSGCASRMLRETLAVLRSQRPFLEGDAASLAAYRDGWRMWQEFYGTHLVNEIRAHVAERAWWPALRKAITLAHYHPRGLAHHVVQKTRVTLRWRGRANPAGSFRL
jgi:glycosyltransferase involved in cell wall biosynthesis